MEKNTICHGVRRAISLTDTTLFFRVARVSKRAQKPRIAEIGTWTFNNSKTKKLTPIKSITSQPIKKTIGSLMAYLGG
jgi:hypothetical protein